MKLTESQFRKLVRQEIKKSRREQLEEATFVAHYKGVAHEFKGGNVKDILKKFINMYSIPAKDWEKIVVKKTKGGLFGF